MAGFIYQKAKLARFAVKLKNNFSITSNIYKTKQVVLVALSFIQLSEDEIKSKHPSLSRFIGKPLKRYWLLSYSLAFGFWEKPSTIELKDPFPSFMAMCAPCKSEAKSLVE